jgi:hypothetical protein
MAKSPLAHHPQDGLRLSPNSVKSYSTLGGTVA